MCGINGIISKSKMTSIEERIRRMNNSIAHRGPDADQFITRKDSIALGHRRLSILDLDPRSNQPMRLDGGKYIIVFNGEIFNFKEIAEQLKVLKKRVGELPCNCAGMCLLASAIAGVILQDKSLMQVSDYDFKHLTLYDEQEQKRLKDIIFNCRKWGMKEEE